MLSQVAFVEQPQKVDFEVEVMGGSTLSGLIPSLKAWLVGFARDSLISMYVMPEHWTYRIDPVSPHPIRTSYRFASQIYRILE